MTRSTPAEPRPAQQARPSTDAEPPLTRAAPQRTEVKQQSDSKLSLTSAGPQAADAGLPLEAAEPQPATAGGPGCSDTGRPRRSGPLPRLRSYAIPQHEPRAASRVLPWDDDDLTPPPTQGTLALALPTVFGIETEDGWPQDAMVSAQQRRPEPSVGLLPEPNAWAATFIQAAMEVAGGLRSAGQLIRWTSPEVHSMLVRRGALTSRARRGGSTIGSKPRLRALLGCTPSPGVCEMSAVIAEPDRVRAVAFRMEGQHGRWRVTELQIG